MNVDKKTAEDPSFILDRMVTVCASCLQASCWQGIFMCDDAKGAGTVEKPVGALAYLRHESADYWFRDPSTGVVDEEAVRSVLCYDQNALRDYMDYIPCPICDDTSCNGVHGETL